jgi:hypothetical protein
VVGVVVVGVVPVGVVVVGPVVVPVVVVSGGGFGFSFAFVPTRITVGSPTYRELQVSSCRSVPFSR